MFLIFSVLLLSSLLQLALSFSPQNSGDAYVMLYKDNTHRTSQQRIFLGDHFLFDISLRNLDDSKDYDSINLINITQSFKFFGEVQNVTFGLEWIQDEVYKLTSVSPAFHVDGKSQNVLLASRNICFTGLVVTDSSNATLPNRIIRKIILTLIDDDFS
uniref:Transmembrane protein 231 n=1 Tax=Cacopsylla melanoneura TaxID=428564 RepID=A0A8D8TGQ4_9HEMI